MGALGTVFDAVVGTFRGMALLYALVYTIGLYIGPFPMFPVTKLVMLSVVAAVVWDRYMVADGDDYGPSDLLVSLGLGFGLSQVV